MPASSGTPPLPQGRTINNNNTSQASLPGRVVRLNFTCRAELPIGSFLRVTGSSLWAPGASALDPAEAAPAVHRTEPAAFFVNSSECEAAVKEGGSASLNALYASSVEMVTTPETYPVWTTRKPVVVVLHRHAAMKKSVQHHYYRYLVVSPGAVHSTDAVNRDDPTAAAAADDGGAIVSTSNESIGSTVVMQWEDPFQSLGRAHNLHINNPSGGMESTLNSTVSLTSTIGLPQQAHTLSDYRNLPYRTLDIDVATARCCVEDSSSSTGSVMVVVDHWNVADDATFQPYLIREAVRCVFVM